MRNPFVLALLGVLIAGGAFVGGLFVQNKFALVGNPPAPGTEPKPETTWAEKKAAHKKVLLDYLDGREIQDKQKKTANGADGKPLVFRKADIEAVKFDDSAGRVNNGPWDTSVTLVGSAGGKRYAVRGNMEYREIDDQFGIAIVSFTATEVSPQ